MPLVYCPIHVGGWRPKSVRLSRAIHEQLWRRHESRPGRVPVGRASARGCCRVRRWLRPYASQRSVPDRAEPCGLSCRRCTSWALISMLFLRLLRPIAAFVKATSSAVELRPYCAVMHSCPSACRGAINLLKQEPSAQSPWQNTMLGLVCMAVFIPPLFSDCLVLCVPGTSTL
jgi:hypothetical protein